MIFEFPASFCWLIILLAQRATGKQSVRADGENEHRRKNQIIFSFQQHALFDHPPMQISFRARGRVHVSVRRIHAYIYRRCPI
jgi:hypothetical protein